MESKIANLNLRVGKLENNAVNKDDLEKLRKKLLAMQRNKEKNGDKKHK